MRSYDKWGNRVIPPRVSVEVPYAEAGDKLRDVYVAAVTELADIRLKQATDDFARRFPRHSLSMSWTSTSCFMDIDGYPARVELDVVANRVVIRLWNNRVECLQFLADAIHDVMDLKPRGQIKSTNIQPTVKRT